MVGGAYDQYRATKMLAEKQDSSKALLEITALALPGAPQ